jgi:CheY-like chemotaxis protein/predicted Ser/Thr protein kinase
MLASGPKKTEVAGGDATEAGSGMPAPLAADLRAGTVLGGYRLHELIGRGGMGVVYRAEHLHLARTVALKLLLPELAGDASFRERFLRESRTAAALDHPNLVTVYDAGEADALLYIAMQYIDGTDLAALLADEGALEPERALTILGQLAQALDRAHSVGIVHRDVKPGNVLIDAHRAYLTDFGLTRSLSSERALTVDGRFVGTVAYMPPEQIEGGPLDPRSDVYALGCMLYQALTGAVPFGKDSDVSVIYAHLQEPPPSTARAKPGLPSGLDAVIAKALAKRKEDRYETCTELMAAARAAIAAGSAGTAPREGAARSQRRVLVAGGERTIRAMIRVTLGNGSFEVLESRDGEEAIALARQVRPELVLVDSSVSDVSLPDLCRRLRDGAGTTDLKLVAITARAEAVEDGTIRAAGADGHLRKPFSPIQLLAAVGVLVESAVPG